ncbi:hypothetical protein M4V62_27295 [Streptomyces durmitorensis]|uniref:Uncharacterized protein n=1 Tax=Streptomyces durmitorensis TaxID=319947 RepID=A0ABY4Q063_9ACTN|nr:hypothetical protein [Streptomyces durmitorensis]UQT58483.1 hypothetical protein M4V62_27295 [Streptomyces durmitorensis]
MSRFSACCASADRSTDMMRGMKLPAKRLASMVILALSVAGYALLLWRGPWWVDGSHLRDQNLEPADGIVITGFRTALVALGAGIFAGGSLLHTSNLATHTRNFGSHARQGP